MASLDDGNVDDLAPGSSPTSATTPPCSDVPANTPWRIASLARSSPGALAYHMPITPSYVQSDSVLASWLPITAVAANSSLAPGLAHDRQVGDGAGGALDLVAEGADRRALVARHERGGVQTAAAVAADLVEWQPGDRLEAGQEDPAVLESVSIGQLVSGELGLLDHVGH